MLYRLSEVAPMNPLHCPSKSFDMYILHPVVFSKIAAETARDGDPLLRLPMMRPATEKEWQQWGDEVLEEMKEIKPEF